MQGNLQHSDSRGSKQLISSITSRTLNKGNQGASFREDIFVKAFSTLKYVVIHLSVCGIDSKLEASTLMFDPILNANYWKRPPILPLNFLTQYSMPPALKLWAFQYVVQALEQS